MDRLVHQKHDLEELVLKRYDIYERNIALLEETFKNNLYVLDAHDDIDKVGFKLAETIFNPPI